MSALERTALLYARFALGTAFLSAVADRFGLWGAHGATNVAWGDMGSFLAYAGRLNWFLPAGMVTLVGWTATVLEIALGMLLLAGYRLPITAAASGVLLASFALAMTCSTGVKTAFDASVYSASAGAFLLALAARRTR
jgi:hypothetical protein